MLYEQHNKKCIKCKTNFIYLPEETWWDEQGMTSTKLVKCTNCECVQAVKYGKDYNDVNYDIRYYSYK